MNCTTAYQSNALAHPRAMVVKTLHAVVANGTMRAAGRTIKHARVTVLHSHWNTIDHNFFSPWELKAGCLSSPNIKWHGWLITEFFLRWMRIPRNDTRVSGWCEKEKTQYLSELIIDVKWDNTSGKRWKLDKNINNKSISILDPMTCFSQKENGKKIMWAILILKNQISTPKWSKIQIFKRLISWILKVWGIVPYTSNYKYTRFQHNRIIKELQLYVAYPVNPYFGHM